MDNTFNLFWDPQGEEVRENILDKKDEILRLVEDAYIKRLKDAEIEVDENQLISFRKKTLDRYNELWDVKNLNSHKPYIKNYIGSDVDLTKEIEKISHKDEEYQLLIIIDLINGCIIDSFVVNEGLSTISDVGLKHEVAKKEVEYLKRYNNLKDSLYGIVHVHNHPKTIAAIPSFGDFRSYYKYLFIYDYFGLKPLDFMVLSDCDLYSQRQHDDNEVLNERTLFYRDKTADEDNLKFKITTDITFFEKRK